MIGQYTLPWGSDEKNAIPIPSHWCVVLECVEKTREPVQDFTAEIQGKLDHPIDSPPLYDIVNSDTRIALVMDDIGCPTLINLNLPVLLDYLAQTGTKFGNSTGLLAIGTHNVMSKVKMTAKAGGTFMDWIIFFNFDCHKRDEFVDLGSTVRGTPVLINRIAVDADFWILVGTIEPHLQAGFGGGYKIIVTGLAASESIAHNHFLLLSPFDYNMVGTLPSETPCG